jgi:8-oxo-dGTP pyrophosphatase MutT (NUDIX family)
MISEDNMQIIFENIPIQKDPKFRSKCFGGIIRVRSLDHYGEYEYAIIQGRATGKWSFPKGHSKRGETSLECAMREISEETGIPQFLLSSPIHFIRLASGKYYIFELNEKCNFNPKDCFEVQETKWATIEEMKLLPTNAGIQEFIRRYSNSPDRKLFI